MNVYKKRKPFISLVCAISLIVSMISIPVVAADTNCVTATTGATIKQGNSAYCYVNIDSTEGLAALDVTVHYDPAKVKITNVYNSVSCTLYDSVINSDNIQFSYILDGKGAATQTRLFYFQYQVLSDAEVGDAYFDITIGEAYDNSLNEMTIVGSRCRFTVAEKVTSKSCSVYGSSSVSTAIEQEFTLTYRFSTYQIASGTAIISYAPELFEVVGVTNGAFLTNKVVDVNTALTGEIYVSFVGTEYYSNTNLVSVTFRTTKNVTETSQITFKATELIDRELNAYSCRGYTTTVQVAHDDSYIGDAPKMSVLTECDEAAEKVYATIVLEDNAHLGAGDFSLTFDPAVLTLASYEQKIAADFFLVNDKELADGVFKFSIISLTDIDTACQVIRLVFDVAHLCEPQAVVLDLSGSMMVDSLTNTIPLNLIDGNVTLSDGWVKGHVYDSADGPDCDINCTICGSVLGHDLTQHVAQTPTCTEIGWNAYETCSRCDYTTYVELPATGHSYVGACDRICNVCGGIREAEPHTYVLKTSIEPTMDEDGAATYSCSICGDTYTEAIPKLVNVPCGDDLTATFANGTLTISGSGAMYEYTEDEAAPWAYLRPFIKDVVLTEGVTTIGSYAFAQCTKLTCITIPTSLKSSNTSPFDSCYQMKAVYITDLEAWCNIDFNHLFANPVYFAKNLYLNGELVTDLVVPDGITAIKDYAFFRCTGITSVTLPKGVTSIGQGAFWQCNKLASMTIPGSLVSVGGLAFNDCTQLNTVYYQGKQSDWDSFMNDSNANKYLANVTVVFVPCDEHTWDDDFDVDCNDCGAIRQIAMKVLAYCGASVSEDVNGLAFLFNAYVSGSKVENGNEYVTNSASVVPYVGSESYRVVRMGAVVSNQSDAILDMEHVDGECIVNVEAVHLWGWRADALSFAIRIIDIPDKGKDTLVTARPYYVYEVDGEEIVVYGAARSATYNSTLA